jgi:hypothetical protein
MTVPTQNPAVHGNGRIVVFVDSQTDAGRLDDTVRGAEAEVLMIAIDRTSRIDFGGPRPAVELRYLDEFGPSELEVRRQTMTWLRDWANTPLPDGTSVKERIAFWRS